MYYYRKYEKERKKGETDADIDIKARQAAGYVIVQAAKDHKVEFWYVQYHIPTSDEDKKLFDTIFVAHLPLLRAQHYEWGTGGILEEDAALARLQYIITLTHLLSLRQKTEENGWFFLSNDTMDTSSEYVFSQIQ